MECNKRNLIILFDGTWNDASENADDLTNVCKIYKLLDDTSDNQVTYYEEGVGTKSYEALTGGIFGKGIEERLLGAYRFLQGRFFDKAWEHYQNRIYIFGFSRGAYTARVFAQILYFCGIPYRQESIPEALKVYYKQDEKRAAELKQNDLFDVEIEMLGLWDTVKSTQDPDRHDETLYPNVKHAYHAMAIDEKRSFFPVLRFNNDERIKEIWFPGVHSDIGGGYSIEHSETKLSNIALMWIVEAAKQNGIYFSKEQVAKVETDSKGIIHNSYTGVWTTFGKKIRRIQDNDLIHSSVRDRIQSDLNYNPINLPTNPMYC